MSLDKPGKPLTPAEVGRKLRQIDENFRESNREQLAQLGASLDRARNEIKTDYLTSRAEVGRLLLEFASTFKGMTGPSFDKTQSQYALFSDLIEGRFKQGEFPPAVGDADFEDRFYQNALTRASAIPQGTIYRQKLDSALNKMRDFLDKAKRNKAL